MFRIVSRIVGNFCFNWLKFLYVWYGAAGFPYGLEIYFYKTIACCTIDVHCNDASNFFQCQYIFDDIL